MFVKNDIIIETIINNIVKVHLFFTFTLYCTRYNNSKSIFLKANKDILCFFLHSKAYFF